MTTDEQCKKYDEIAREICALTAEEDQEMRKAQPDMYALHLIAQERADLEAELYNI